MVREEGGEEVLIVVRDEGGGVSSSWLQLRDCFARRFCISISCAHWLIVINMQIFINKTSFDKIL